MPPKQATLGKFFGNPQGVKSKPQQSTLAFNRAQSPNVEKLQGSGENSTNGSVVENGTEDAEKQEDVELGGRLGIIETASKESALKIEKPKVSPNHKFLDPVESAVTDEDMKDDEANATATASSNTSRSISPPSKRRSRELRDVDDEEPVRKRSRRGDVQKKQMLSTHYSESTKPKEPQKGGPVRSKAGKGDFKSKNNSSKNSAAFPNEQDSTVTTKPHTSEEEEVVSRAKPGPKKEVQIREQIDEDETASEAEDEEADSEEDKPEIAAKTREKVNSTLTSSGKDPFPDWPLGEPVPYAALCTTFSLIELTTKRLIISAHCSLFLRQVLRLTPLDLLPTVQLMINKLAADYAGIELGIGESLIMKAIGESTGRSLQVIKTDQNEIGDLGLVAAKSRSNQPTMFKPKALTVKGVLDGLMNIAVISGDGSQGRKIAGIKKLLSAADASFAGTGSKGIDITKDKGGASEAKFIIRFLEGKLRLGLAEKTVLVALAHAMVIHETERKGNKLPSSEQLANGESILKTVYSELPSYEVIVPTMLEHGIFNLRENCKLQPGIPLKPMLAKPTKSITEVLDRFEGKNFTCEYKYDGERAQIHYVAEDSPVHYTSSLPASRKKAKGLSAIFSRNSEDLSKKYPDILAKLDTWVKPETKSFVLDCETVAWDLVEKKVLPFQQLMTRKRKDVKVEDVMIKVCVFAFDILFYNGEAVVERSLRERRELLHIAFEEVESEFSFAQYGNTNELEEIQMLLDESVKASCEGLMIKMLDTSESGYEPSKRSRNWLKVKKDYVSGIGDSLDLVVLGAYFGKGKRTSVYGAFLLASYNSSKQVYETICNIGTGFSEAILDEFHGKLKEIVIDKPKPFYAHSSVVKDQPDIWFEPRLVWEVKAADLTLSPRYKAGCDALSDTSGKGISLRFPRFIKERDDKRPEEATGSRMVVELYQKQENVAKSKEPAVDDDFEY
ncbi:hypothetical protein MMC29_001123 [Sticta canariensis]|nr:hypothetical protein [Sticta canariensis]